MVAGLIFLPAALYPQQNSTPGRSAHLSSVIGNVTINRPLEPAAIPATVNMPIEDGDEIVTASGAYAAVGLENGSSIQLNGLTKAEITQLRTDGEGNRVSLVTLEKGYADFHFVPEHQDIYTIRVADATMTPSGKSQFHIGYASGKISMYVSAGSVAVSAHANSVTVAKGKSMEYLPAASAEVAKSHVRVVRLSYVSGTVIVKRPGSSEEERAMINTPIQEGFELSTSGGSYAEVEFENGSTARIGEVSSLVFTQLALDAAGNKLNSLTFDEGYGTFHFVPEHNYPTSTKQHDEYGTIYFQPNYTDVYHVKIADTTVTAHGKCEFRTDLDRDRYRVEVFSGSVEVATPTMTSELAAGKALEHNSGTTELAYSSEKAITKDAWDQWTEARDRQAQLTSMDEAVHPYGSSYGWGDLNTYGEWVQLSSGRSGWTPYVGAGWAPYTMGSWNWYAGMGYTWISSEPWGWTPYHCGMWDFDDSMGWYWMPPMAGCGMWQPSLVSWFNGPGWIGWAPGVPAHRPGTGGGPPHPGPPLHPPRGIVKVSSSVVQNREMITPSVVNHGPFTGGVPIERPPFAPNPRPVATTATVAGGGGISIKGNSPTGTGPAAGAGFANHGSAPATILMGGDPAREGLLLAEHGSHSARAPLRTAGGLTLGGHYELHGSPGEFRGTGSSGAGRNSGANGRSGPMGGPMLPSSSGSRSGPVIASHGSNGGGFAGSSAGRSGGGGFSGGASSGHSGGGGGGFSGAASSGGGGHSGGGGGASSGGGGGGHH
jgi:ferric-dicitrate binding protein FerR (iron transport regulator)